MTDMAPVARKESLRDAYGETLVSLGEADANLVVLDADPTGFAYSRAFAARFPDRAFVVDPTGPTMMARAAELSRSTRTVFANTYAALAAGPAYDPIRRSICTAHANVKIVATHGPTPVDANEGTPSMMEDLGLMRGLPGMTVIVPGDAPTTRSAVRAVAGFHGPAYLRLAREDLPTVTDGTFVIGRANELRGGSDLTIIAIGTLLARALAVADELGRVGISARVLDLASVKPVDIAGLVRAARDTGAILVLEEHTVETGIGALVAATTSENYPIPVRRVGVPDVFAENGETEAILDHLGLSTSRIMDEAWELLELRGKVQ